MLGWGNIYISFCFLYVDLKRVSNHIQKTFLIAALIFFYICVDKTQDDPPNNFACYWDGFLSTFMLHKVGFRPLAEMSRLYEDDEKLPFLNENILIQGFTYSWLC